MPPSNKDKTLHNLIISALAVKGYPRTRLAERLMLSYHTFANRLASPGQFTIADLRIICKELDLNLTEVKRCI